MAFVFKRGGRYYVRYKDRSGHWQKVSCGAGVKKHEAEFLEKTYSAKELNFHHKAPVRIVAQSLPEALEIFRDKVLPRGVHVADKQESSTLREKTTVDNYLKYLAEHKYTKFEQVGLAELQEYVDWRVEKAEIGPRTRREERRVTRKFYKWAMKQGFCTENPAEELVAPAPAKKRPRYFTEEELAIIFEAARGVYRDIDRFMYLTGLRSGEIANLEWPDWKVKEKLLTIRIVSQDKKNRIPGNKTKREETIPLSKEAIEILESRKAAAPPGEPHIFLNEAGNRLDDDNIYRNLKRILDDKGITNASPHTFRHTFASHLVIKGVSLYMVKELLRHRSIRETEIYAHLSKENIKGCVELLQTKSFWEPGSAACTAGAAMVRGPGERRQAEAGRTTAKDGSRALRLATGVVAAL